MADFAVADPMENFQGTENVNPYSPEPLIPALQKRFQNDLFSDSSAAVSFLTKIRETQGVGFEPGGEFGVQPTFDPSQIQPNVDPKTLQQKFPTTKGLDTPMPVDVASDIADAQARQARQAAAQGRYPSGTIPFALGFGADVAASLLDPADDAANFIPVIGEARYARWLASAGERAGLLGRLGVTFGVGAARGAAAQVPLSGLRLASAIDQGTDYTLGNAAWDTLIGGASGGVLHTGLSFHGDVMGARFLETPEGKDAASSASLHDAAIRTAASQMVNGLPIDVEPIFAANRTRADLMSSAAIPRDAGAEARFADAHARANGAPSSDAMRWTAEASEAAHTPPDKVSTSAMAEAARAVEAMRARGELTPEDEALLKQFETPTEAAINAQPSAAREALDREFPKVSTKATTATPETHLPAATADIAELRSRIPAGERTRSLFDTIRAMGGIRLRNPDGTPVQFAAEIKKAMEGQGRGTLVRKNGLTPDRLREALAEQGWFGSRDTSQTDLNDLHDLIDREARGEKIYHPESPMQAALDRRKMMAEEADRAGVTRDDTHAVAAQKLAEFRSAAEVEHAAWLKAADDAGIEHDPEATPEDILADAIERDAIMAERAGTGEEFADRANQWIDDRLWRIAPDIADNFRNEDLIYESAPESALDVNVGTGRPGAEGSGPPGDLGTGGGEPGIQQAEAAGAGVTGEGTADRGEPAPTQVEGELGAAETPAERAAREGRRAIEESQQLPRANSGKEQRPLGEELFAPPKTPTMFQMQPRADTFYSALTRGVENIKQERGTADQWRGIIDNLPGVKKEEVEWSGVKEWLADQKGAVSKTDVLSHLRENEVRISEVQRGEPQVNRTSKYYGPQVARVLREASGEALDNVHLQLSNDGKAYAELTRKFPELADNEDWADVVLNDVLTGESRRASEGQIRMRAEELAGQSGEMWSDLGPNGRQRFWEQAARELDNPGTKFGTYVLPGGEPGSYRELLLTLPEQDTGAVKALHEAKYEAYKKLLEEFEKDSGLERHQTLALTEGVQRGNTPSRGIALMRQAMGTEKADALREEVYRANREYDKAVAARTGQTFRSGHFQEPNVLAHIRFDDRTGPNGEKILHIAEVQSDWHQKGRRQGYQASPEVIKALADTREAARRARLQTEQTITKELTGGKHPYVSGILSDDSLSSAEARKLYAEVTRALETDPRMIAADDAFERANEAMSMGAGEVPNAPFKTSWQEVSMKRMLRYAAENGYDKLTWDTGETQASRYDLSKQIDHLFYKKNADGTYRVSAQDKSGRGHLLGDKIAEKDLENHVGKDVAKRIADGVGQDTNLGSGSGTSQLDMWKQLNAENLTVGGEGMRGFYDKILPQFMSKYVKKWGAKVGEESLPLTEKGQSFADVLKATGKSRDEWMAMSPAERGRAMSDAGIGTAIHSVDITPEMRKSVMEGQPLFQRPFGRAARAEGTGERVQLADDLIGRTLGHISDDEARVLNAVDEVARTILPRDTVVRPMRSLEATGTFSKEAGIEAGHVTGATYANGMRRLIAWSLESPNAVGTLRHEAIHYLLGRGLIRQSEWEALVRAAHAEDWIGKHNIDARYPGASPEVKLEEAIAEEFGSRGTQDGRTVIGRTIARVRDFIAKIGDKMREMFGADVTANDVFRRISSGEVANRRPAFDEASVAGPSSFQLTPEQEARQEQMDAAVKARAKLTAYQDLQKRNALTMAVNDFKGKGLSLANSIDALTRGINTAVEGARDSTAAEQLARQNDLLGQLQANLDKEGLMTAWRNRTHTANWVRELFELNSKDGKPGITKDTTALKIAQAVNKAQDTARLGLNRSGAWVGDYDGYVARTRHDSFKIDKAGYQPWHDFTLERLDAQKTFADILGDDTLSMQDKAAAVDKFMTNVWHALSTGIHMSSDHGVGRGKNPAFAGIGNLAKKLSSERVLHWKDADAWREYQEKFGDPVIERGVMEGLRRAGSDTALMNRWGTNPAYTFDNLIRTMKEQNRDDHAAVGDLAKAEPRLREEFGYLTGTNRMPGNRLAAQISGTVRAWQDISKLAFVLFTHMSVGATKPFQLKYHGIGRWQAYTSVLRNLFQDTSPEGRSVMENLRANATGQSQDILSGYEPIDGVPGHVAKLRSLSMRLGGLPWMLGRQKSGTEWELANFLGQRVGSTFDALHPSTQRALKIYGIGQPEWDALRNAPGHDHSGDGDIFLTPQAAQRANPADIDALAGDRLAQVGQMDPDAVDRIRGETRDKLGMKLAAYYSDSADRSTVTPGIPERAMFSRAGGKFLGPIIGQYKTWATAAVRQMWGQAIYGSSKGEAVKALAELFAVGTALGFARNTIADVLRGKNPDLPNDDWKHDANLFLAAASRGGGMGIFGDFILGQLQDTAGTGLERAGRLISTLAGPTVSDTARLLGIGLDYLTAVKQKRPGHALQNANAEALRMTIDNLPLVNTFYTRTLANYLILDRLQDMASPGYTARYRHRIKQQSGQTFWMPPQMGH